MEELEAHGDLDIFYGLYSYIFFYNNCGFNNTHENKRLLMSTMESLGLSNK